MDPEKKPCGCWDEGDTSYVCEMHWCALNLSSFSHPWGGHEECCDKHLVSRLVDEFGAEAVRAGAEALSEQSIGDYVKKVVGMVLDE